MPKAPASRSTAVPADTQVQSRDQRSHPRLAVFEIDVVADMDPRAEQAFGMAEFFLAAVVLAVKSRAASGPRFNLSTSPWPHFLYLRLLPHGHGAFRPIFNVWPSVACDTL
jgi:hypothetical protein